MAGVCLLNSIHGKKPNGIDTELVELRLLERLILRAYCGMTIQGIIPPDDG
jgi:hypothetical protein